MSHKRVPTIAIDFDGVIHSYTSGWKGAHVIPDPPVPGAIEFLIALLGDGSEANPVIFSSRAKTWRGRRAIRAWLREHSGPHWNEDAFFRGISSVKVTAKKPPASVYLDDRAVRFEGEFPELRSLAIRDFVNQPVWFRKEGPSLKAVCAELENLVTHESVEPGDTLSHRTARACVDRGFADKRPDGAYVATRFGREEWERVKARDGSGGLV